ncbi:MAG: cobalamin biosynthesis protein [Nitrososphaeraceae archaeon]
MIYEQFILLGGGLALGILLDLVFGDPRNRYHPVSWLGKLIESITPKLKHSRNIAVSSISQDKIEKVKGIMFSCGLISGIALLAITVASLTALFMGILITLIMFAVLLKISIALKGMEKSAIQIVRSIEAGNLEEARYSLSMIVRRDTSSLNEDYVQSATIECISESTVDGIISPLFFYSILGPVGCIVYRVVNTLDSMLGYKDPYYKDIGWMSAKLDTIFNFLPARITGLLMIVSAYMVQADWKNSLVILIRDHHKTTSINAGYPMSSMAGALRVRLEKMGSYTLGEGTEFITVDKCMLAIKIMKITTLLFCLVFSLPLILLLSHLGWWNLIFGI